MGWLQLGIADHWAWLIIGLVLMTAELLAPGVFLMWVGGAALLTGLITLALPIGDSAQLFIFGVSAIAAVYAARRWFALNKTSENPKLNNRAAQMVGQVVTVVEAIDGGSGRVKVGDSVWNARGPDAPVGARVRIIGADGSLLEVVAV